MVEIKLELKESVRRVVENLREQGELEWVDEYGEQGYSVEEGKLGILLSNWNPFNDNYPNFMELLEQHFELEWSDEWVLDWDNGGKAYRCVGNSYCWEQQFRYTDSGEMLTPNRPIEDWIEHCVLTEDDHKEQVSALPSFIEFDAAEHGFIEIDEEYENGWYGRADDPKEIAQKLFKEENAEEILFQISDVGQFSLGFKVFFKRKEVQEN